MAGLRTWTLCGLSAAAILSSAVLVSAERQPPAEIASDVSAFMRLKLNHAQKILEGIALEDYEMIVKNSQQMALLAQDEDWMVYETPEYKHHSADFRRIANKITDEARKRDLDAATEGYVLMTKSCVNCHKYTRGVRMASIN